MATTAKQHPWTGRRRPLPTHCRRGHRYGPEDIEPETGWRFCRECKRKRRPNAIDLKAVPDWAPCAGCGALISLSSQRKSALAQGHRIYCNNDCLFLFLRTQSQKRGDSRNELTDKVVDCAGCLKPLRLTRAQLATEQRPNWTGHHFHNMSCHALFYKNRNLRRKFDVR